MKTGHKIVLLFIAVLLVDLAFGQGCSQCKMLSEQGSGHGGSEEASFGTNINYGILYLMAVPYLLLVLFFRKRIVSGFKSLVRK